MKLEFISSKNAPAALGPYCQAVKAGNQLYVSGCLGMIPATGDLAGDDIVSQTKQVFKNIDAILTEAGFVKTDAVKCNVFLANLADFAECNKVYAEYFGNHKPARACVEVSKMVKGALVEIDVVCVK